MIRKIISIIGISISLLSIFITFIAMRLLTGLDIKIINNIVSYASYIDIDIKNSEINLLLLLAQINKYSHLIITLSAICIAICIYIWMSSRRNKNEQK